MYPKRFRFILSFIVALSLAIEVYLVEKYKRKEFHLPKYFKPEKDKNFTKLLIWIHRDSKPYEINCGNGKIKVYHANEAAKPEEMDVIFFHVSYTEQSSIPRKHVNQTWIMYSIESPSSLKPYFATHNFRKMQHKIDLVSSYRQDADIFAPYGFSYKTSEDIKNGEIRRIPLMLAKDRRYVNGYYKSYLITKDVGKVKGKQVAWLVSNCGANSNRQAFVKELSKYIQVDIYGGCGRQCPRADDCRLFIAHKYNFYLSFENSLCKDYASEKLFETLRVGMLPIVFGSANYSDILPPKSFIDALSFKSPKELAKYLISISRSRRLYASYFEWRKSYKIFFGTHEAIMCNVYDALREKRKSRNGVDIFKFFGDDSKCWWWRKGKAT